MIKKIKLFLNKNLYVLFVLIGIFISGLILIPVFSSGNNVLSYSYNSKKISNQNILSSNILSSEALNLRTIELADSNSERAEGLMYRDNLCEQCAMLFVFGYPTTSAFWMKNTKISLDIIYLDQNGKIINYHTRTQPMNSKILYKPKAKYWYVLETNAGFVEKYNLREGMALDIRDLITRSNEVKK